MPTIEKRGSRYRALVRVKGQGSKSRTFNTYNMAERWANKTQDEMRAGDLGKGGDRRFADVLPEYIAELAQRQLHTQDEIEVQLQDWCKVLGPLSLSRITPAIIADHRNRLAATLKGGTVNRKLAALSGFFKWLVQERGTLKANPVKAVRRGKESPARVRYLTDAERERLFDACRRVDYPALYPLVVVACFSGCRQGELLNLNWQDVDLVNGWLHIRTSKNGEPRMVPLQGPALAVLKAWRHHAGENVTTLPVGKVFGIRSFPQKPWKRALQLAEVKDFRFHDTRHTAASYLVQSGAQLTDVASILGHRTLSMAMKYSHLSPARVSDVMSTMIAKFGG